MEDKESQGQTSPGKPFALRPSALSSPSGGFGSSLQQANKPLLLRPSALTAIADKLETGTEVKKRKADAASSEGVPEDDEGNKKPKVVNEPKSPSGGLQLTEAVVPPQGIGTFGFIDNGGHTKDSKSSKGSGSNSNALGFIFGQNINERVTGFQDVSKSESSNDGKVFECAEEISEKDHEQKLADNANEHMKKEESSKLHLTEVEVVTGEEGERNVLQIQCKVHLLCQEKAVWIERGRGTLKLNDICKSENHDIFQSRVVFRRLGSHQVVLNTLLWPEMCYDKASSKSLRITAIDHETENINIFLVTGSPKDIIQLHTAIDRRVIALKRNQSDANTSACAEETSDNETNDGCEGDASNSNSSNSKNNEADREATSGGEIKDEDQNEGSSEQNDSGNSNDGSERET